MNQATVLVLDDDDAAILPLTLFLRREGHRVLSASDAQEALAHLGRERVAVVLADQRLPGMSGTEFLSRVRQQWPDTIRILLTGYADTATAIASINQGHVYRYMAKPWNTDELREVVRDSVRAHELMRENRRLYELTVNQALELRALNEALEKKVAERTAEVEIKNTQLEENLLDVIRLLTGVLDLRNASMAGHAQRVGEAGRWLARVLGLPEAEQRDIEIAAILHDIGKLGLPDRVLHKDTYTLVREDQELLRQGPLLGEALLSTVPRLRAAAKIIRHQGEWFNGRGYPEGLAGEAIPIGSRIIAVVEAYEKFGERQALRQGEGRLYDPRVVGAFLRYLDEQGNAARSGAEVRLDPGELKEGMVLTRDLYTGQGLLLVTSGKVIDRPTLDKIRNFHRVDPIPGKVSARG